MEYILSLDQGTTSSRSILFGKDGNIVAQASREFQQIYPQGGWVEHDPFDILTSQMSSVVEVLGKAGIRARDLAAALASPISGKPRLSGTGRRASRSTTRLSGRIAEPRNDATR